ncbi:MAG: SDR family oxidoreductase [Spirochaetales bacterium]|nr:SDR family oxidoreductase [Spirochaetales bacterium]
MDQKSVVITGSSRGIGFTLAAELLKAGCRVMVSGKSEEHLRRAAERFKEHGDRLGAKICDVTKLADLEALWNEAKERFGTVDVWVNNAGIGQDWRPVWELDPHTVRYIVDTNVIGLIHGAQVAFRGMKAQGAGRIWNMEGFGSDGRTMSNLSVYGATKRAVAFFTDSLAREARGTGVLVGSLRPGMTATDFVLAPLRRDPERLKKSLPILNIIADKPETVASFLAPRVIADRRQGARVRWLTGGRLFLRFLTAPFVKRKVFDL